MSRPHLMQNYIALLDDSTKAVLVIGNTLTGLAFLQECTPNTSYIPFVNDPHYTKTFLGSSFLSSMKPEDFPKWTWNKDRRVFVKTAKNILTNELKGRSSLAYQKYLAINVVITNLNVARNEIMTGVRFQEEVVYPQKKFQAERFQKTGYDANRIADFPYISQYADFENISYKQAADDIIFKAKLDDQNMINTELLRLVYFQKIREANSPKQLSSVLDTFRSDIYHIV